MARSEEGVGGEKGYFSWIMVSEERARPRKRVRARASEGERERRMWSIM